jgi:DNA repair exonuclease SbcCD nuclease subunit
VEIQTTKPILLTTDFHWGLNKNNIIKRKILVNFINDLIRDNKDTSDTLIFMGDFFHNRTFLNVETINIAYNSIKKLCKHFKMYFVVGNHDIFNQHNTKIHSLKQFSDIPNLFIIDKPTKVKINDKSAWFFPWNSDVKNIKDEKVDYSFSHLHPSDIIYHATRGDLVVEDITKKSEISFLGHFHNKNEMETRSGKAIWPGSPYQQNFGEAKNDCGYYLLDTLKETLKFVENKKSPRYIKLYMSTLTEKQLEKVNGNFVRLVIDEQVDYLKIIEITNTINKKGPLELSNDYVITSNNAILNKEYSEEDMKLSLSKLEYMKKFLDKMDNIDKNHRRPIYSLLEGYYSTNSINI